MEQRLIDQLNEWHEEDKHQRIVDSLSAIPNGEQNYESISRLARAYNNLGHYEEALIQFDKISEAGQEDSLWHYRVGFALYHLGRFEEAVQAFRRSNQLEPANQNTEYFLQKAEKQKEKDFGLPRRKHP